MRKAFSVPGRSIHPTSFASILLYAAVPLLATVLLHATGSVASAQSISCSIYCVPEKARTATARVTLPEGTTPSGEQLVDVTVYPDGFAKGQFVTLQAQPANQPVPRSGQGTAPVSAPTAAAERKLPGLDTLKVVPQAARPQSPESAPTAPDDAPKRPRRSSPSSTQVQSQTAAALVVELEGIKAGLQYSFRIRSVGADGTKTSAIATCRAPVCPADIREPRK